ncbi:DUF2284 domain-containing protein [Clostridium cylindrosporum]|uniref:Metal-binding protein n=1 Tax=Clostridium cylindrosporum DSM 605 TaxID=1121307 RepID=A0A0J8D823_CLOCY|nr:DUF2284 domain-containing protein [Clostridium cylindrosporum]KMT22210.1 hypothetical protein CLCY_4c01830 [Clostridium cylindrosporum DSM 605]
MISTTFRTKTPKAEIIISAKVATIEINELSKYEKKDKFSQLCMEGCPNYGSKWSCPPYSPSFMSYSKKFKYAMVLLLSCNLSQFDYTKQEYMKIKVSNSILKSRTNKIMRALEDRCNGIMLAGGSCRLCKPCALKSNQGSCKKPTQMRFTMESLGLDVESICLDFFNYKLLWYKDKKAPEYASVVSCLLSENPINEAEIISFIENFKL